MIPEIYSSSPVQDLTPFILNATTEDSLSSPGDLATTLWFKNKSHADWGLVAWKGIMAAIGTRSWDPSIEAETMASRFSTFVWSLDQHLPHGIEGIIQTWFETGGTIETMRLPDEAWTVMASTFRTLSLKAIISPQTLLLGLVYPVWEHISRSQESWILASVQRTFKVVEDFLLCHPDLGDQSIDCSQIHLFETCRTRLYHPSCIPSLLLSLSALLAAESNEVLDSGLREAMRVLRTSLQADPTFQVCVMTRINMLVATLDTSTKKYPDIRRTFVKDLISGFEGIESTGILASKNPIYSL